MQSICTRKKSFLLFIIILFGTSFLQAQKIITVAGNSNGNGPGYSRKLNENPTSYGIALDGQGNIFFSEIDKSTVTKIDVEGNVVLVAGNISEPGFSGDGELATNARLDGPRGITVDKDGNIYIADTYNGRVRKVDQNGIITTIAGGGKGGDGGLAVKASLSDPVDVILDSAGNIFISEQGNNKIRKVNKNGIISTVAGNGIAGFSGDSGKAVNASLKSPTGICFDKNGNLLIADTDNERIRKVNRNGVINTIAGNGSHGDYCNGGSDNILATNAAIGEPTDIDIDTAGKIFLVASYNCAVQYIDEKGYLQNLTYNRDQPQSLTYSRLNNVLYFSTIYEDVCWGYVPNVVHFNLSTLKEKTIVGGDYRYPEYNGDSIASTVAQLSYPGGTAFTNGNLYFVDESFYRIRKLDERGIITTFAGNGVKGSNGFGDGGLAINASFNDPTEIAVDKQGNIYISDNGDNRIRKINAQGIITTAYVITAPRGLAFDKTGNQFVSSYSPSSLASKVFKIDTAGTITKVAGTDGSGFNGDNILAIKATLAYPAGVYVDKVGNLYIADQGNDRIRKVDTSGIITTVAGYYYSGYNGDSILAVNAWLYTPTGVTQNANGDLIITDNGNHRIRKVDSKGIITTIAGGGAGDHTNCDGEWFDYGEYSGDDGPAIGSNLNYPYNVAFDKKGNMFISDQSNHRVREVINKCLPKPSPYTIAMQQYINRKFTLQYDCYLLATITPRLNYLSALNANIITNVWVEKKTIKDSSGKPYVVRHYQVVPERNKFNSSTSNITLYFNQSDFDSYNKLAGNSYSTLPSSPDDKAGIKNLVLYGYRGKSKDSSGLPDSYSSKQVTVNPKNKDIVWNDTAQYWEVSFDVNALGGFFIGTEKKSMIISDIENSKAADKTINVYPNPAKDIINISLPSLLLYKPVQLLNMDGRLIHSEIADGQNITIDLKNIASGIYFVRFANGQVKKVVFAKK